MNIFLDELADATVCNAVIKRLNALDVDVSSWAGSEIEAGDEVDAILTCGRRTAIVRGLIGGLPYVRILAICWKPMPDDTRLAIRQGADGVLDVTSKTAAQVFAILATAGGVDVQPAGHGFELASRLESPNRLLSAEETRLLHLVATGSNQAAGSALGYSCRQVQRLLRKLHDDLGFRSRYDAPIAAARWGLLECDGA